MYNVAQKWLSKDSTSSAHHTNALIQVAPESFVVNPESPDARFMHSLIHDPTLLHPNDRLLLSELVSSLASTGSSEHSSSSEMIIQPETLIEISNLSNTELRDKALRLAGGQLIQAGMSTGIGLGVNAGGSPMWTGVVYTYWCFLYSDFIRKKIQGK